MKKLLLFALLIVFSCDKKELASYLLAVSFRGGEVSTTGGNNYDKIKSVITKNRIHHSTNYPSNIRLPFVYN